MAPALQPDRRYLRIATNPAKPSAMASISSTVGESVGIAGARSTLIVEVPALFPAFPSPFALVTDAVFAIGPELTGVTCREIVADAPLASVPSEQVTVVVPEQLP